MLIGKQTGKFLLCQIGSYGIDAQRTSSIDETDAQHAGRNRRENKDTLVANGGGLLTTVNFLPCRAIVRPFCTERLDTLTQRDVFLQHDAIERLSPIHREGQCA